MSVIELIPALELKFESVHDSNRVQWSTEVDSKSEDAKAILMALCFFSCQEHHTVPNHGHYTNEFLSHSCVNVIITVWWS